MWSTSLSCLHMLVAKRSRICGFVYFRWTNFSSLSILLTLLFLICEVTHAQDIPDNSTEITSTKTKETRSYEQDSYSNLDSNLLKTNITIHAYYGHYSLILLNVSWRYPIVKSTIKYFEVYLTGNNVSCKESVEKVETKNAGENSVLLGNGSTTIISHCKYEIKISPKGDGEFNSLLTYYTVPGTSPVSNVNAEAFYVDDERAVKLNISWTNPTDDILPTNYGIKLNPIKSDICTTARFYETFGIMKNVTSTTIPMNDVDIIPGCSYKIDVMVEPSNDLDPPYINYTVPECVGKKCSCQYNHLFPKLIIIQVKQIAKDVIRIKWNISANSTWTKYHNITTIYFSVKPSEHIIPPKRVDHIIYNEQLNKIQYEDIVIPGLITGAFYDVVLWFENHKYCKSNQAWIRFQALFSQETHWVYKVMIPSMFIVMFVCFIWILLRNRCSWCLRNWWICYNQHSATQPQIRRIYRPSTEGYRGRPYLSVPMEYNNLYVEKEILDELERGKVDKYEISYSRLQMGPEIGGGAFGQVFRANAAAIAGIPGYTMVAVKKLNKTASAEELEEFLLEISMLKQIGPHPNIVTLLGCCTLRQPYCMIMEYIPCGDLLHYLRALRVQYEQKGKSFLFTMNKNVNASSTLDKQKLSECSYITPESIPSNRMPSVTETEYTILGSDIMPCTPCSPQPPCTPRTPSVLECILDPKELQSFAVQIARGMQYLEQKQIVHRDLAARNILIDENKTLKISDFGLSRSGIYVNSKQKKVPLRWLSVEAIRDNLYTSKSDVWAYGIVLWEIGTLGGFPYPMVADHEILKFLLKGKRLAKPENCTDELYALMELCWSHAEDQRPSFKELVDHLEAISNRRRVYIDFSQLNPSYIFPPTEQQTVTQIKTEDNVKTIEIVLTDR